MRFCHAFLASLGLLYGQPGVVKRVELRPRALREIVMHVPPPVAGSFIDILATDQRLSVSVILPDGKEMTQSNAEKLGYTWGMLSPRDIDERFAFVLIPGPGQHTFVGIPENEQSGDYRIRIDSRDVGTPSRVGVLLITVEKYLMAVLPTFPGLKITKIARVLPGSTRTNLSLDLPNSTRDAALDIAATDPRVAIALRLPNGDRLTREKAEANNISWEALQWPPHSSGEGWGLFDGFATMLPIRGTHQFITFIGGVRLAGRYTIEVDAGRAESASELRAMFLPAGYLDDQ